MRTVTDRGVWVIVAAKARIAAGDRWASGAPDVFSDAALARKYRALWAFLARELRDEPFVAGVEVMSEPRNKAVAQETVARFYEGVCAAVHRVDNRMPCVVGPTPYYKVWQLNGSMILRDGDGSPMKGIVYTFDFYDPWDFVTSDAEDGYSYPDECAARRLSHRHAARRLAPSRE